MRTEPTTQTLVTVEQNREAAERRAARNQSDLAHGLAPLERHNVERLQLMAAIAADGFHNYNGARSEDDEIRLKAEQIEHANAMLGALTAVRSSISKPMIATSEGRSAWREAEAAILAAEKAVMRARPDYDLREKPRGPLEGYESVCVPRVSTEA